jgi:D-amino-acid dehydrogenase
LTFADHGFVVSKVGSCLRVGGAVELGGLKAPPNFERAKILLSKAKQFLPQMDVGAGQEWMGFRPSMPDSLPVIGSSPKQPRVIYAFGHGHLGLTQSAATAELVRDTILGSLGRLLRLRFLGQVCRHVIDLTTTDSLDQIVF